MDLDDAKQRIKELEESEPSCMEERIAVKDMILELKKEFGLIEENNCSDDECLSCGS